MHASGALEQKPKLVQHREFKNEAHRNKTCKTKYHFSIHYSKCLPFYTLTVAYIHTSLAAQAHTP